MHQTHDIVYIWFTPTRGRFRKTKANNLFIADKASHTPCRQMTTIHTHNGMKASHGLKINDCV
ncbi:MAG: hypothetical protein OEW89_05445 [Gammaproteobacteria bacterium]|nr:hypothetical protein [Gammaproteobacteria bacterium]